MEFCKGFQIELQGRECGRSEGFFVMKEIGMNILRESGQTSTRSLLTREFEKPFKEKGR
jgi:hypothetical protein